MYIHIMKLHTNQYRLMLVQHFGERYELFDYLHRGFVYNGEVFGRISNTSWINR